MRRLLLLLFLALLAASAGANDLNASLTRTIVASDSTSEWVDTAYTPVYNMSGIRSFQVYPQYVVDSNFTDDSLFCHMEFSVNGVDGWRPYTGTVLHSDSIEATDTTVWVTAHLARDSIPAGNFMRVRFIVDDSMVADDGWDGIDGNTYAYKFTAWLIPCP